jgi:forkhead box protein J1
MPSNSRETLAARFRQNWAALNPEEQPLPVAPVAATDDSLTSLNWLQNLNIMKMATPTPPASPEPADDAVTNTHPALNVNPNAVLNMDYGNTMSTPAIRVVKQEPGLNTNLVSPPRVNSFTHELIPPPGTASPGVDKDYKNDPRMKPPYSYAHLICMAMKETKKNKITLAGIYSWITENFLFYKNTDQSWQVNTSHNHLYFVS